MVIPLPQFVDPEITRQKFEEEVQKFLSAREHYRILGVLLLEEAYPDLYFGFTAPTLSPVPIVFAVKINFVNYDVQPLSVKFVHPLTFKPLLRDQLHPNLLRKQENAHRPQSLLVVEGQNDPLFCIPGIREYHNHPFHTGDSWFLHRGHGAEGSLCFILDNLQLYGISHIRAYQMQIQVAAQIPNAVLSSDINSLPL